jgi:predicted dehydrogenase
MSTAVMTAGAAVRGLASPNDTVRMGVVGLGGRGSSHINAWSEMPNVELVAICDVDETHVAQKLKAIAAKGVKTPATYVDVRKMLEDKNIDAISIASPNHWHTLQTIWACQAGKDVYVEKPCSHNVFESQQIIAAARKYDRIVQQGSQSRSSAALQEAVQKMKDGEFGARPLLQVARHNWQDPGGTGAGWC